MKDEKIIPFSPPQILDEDIKEVIKVLKSGWITSGPKTREFEQELTKYCQTEGAVCFNSATAGLFLILKLFDIGPGDEVITSAYTFAASANVIIHCGAIPVLVDINEKDFNIDPKQIEQKISPKTKAIITVDFGGYPVDYDEIKSVISEKSKYFQPRKNTLQEKLARPLFISDCAHSIGAVYKQKIIGSMADFSVFSFHAVKNITTAEGGAIVFNHWQDLTALELKHKIKILSLHGQDKDAFSKYKNNSWQYDITDAGYKFNMTDIQAALGLSQLKRYNDQILPHRKALENKYIKLFSQDEQIILHNKDHSIKQTSAHLMPIRIKNFKENDRNLLIEKLKTQGISTNVHFKPLPLLTAYKKRGYKINDFPESYKKFENQMTCPLYNDLTLNNIEYIVKTIRELLLKVKE